MTNKSCFVKCCSEYEELEPVANISEKHPKSSSATPLTIDELEDPAFADCLNVCNIVAHTAFFFSCLWMNRL